MSDQTQLAIVNSIAQERRTWVWRITLTSLCVVIIGAIFAFSFVDFKTPLPSTTRWVAWAVMIAGCLYFLWRNRKQVFNHYTPAETARAMESARPAAGQKVRTAFEFAHQSGGEETHGFREQLVSETEEFLAGHDWKQLIPRGRGLRWILTFASLVVCLLISSIIWPEFGLGVKRILVPGTTATYTELDWENLPEWFDQRHPPLIQLNVSGRKAVPKLFVKEDSEEEWEAITMNPRDNSSIWDAVLTGREKSFTAYAIAGDGKSQSVRIEYEPIPELREVNVALEFPHYIERENETRKGGDVRALEGTKATWTFVFNTAPAEIKWEIGQAIPELLASAETCISATHSIQAGIRNPVLTVTDRRGRPVDSWRFEVEGLVDQLPKIEILEPAKNRDATTITEIPVRIRASDDYGLGEIGVVLEAVGETKWILEKTIDASNQRQANEMVSAMLEEIPLEITDNVRLYAYSLDRKPRGGPRALSHLRSIDIRQFKRRWKFKRLPAQEDGPKIEREDIAGLEKIIGKQREIVSDIFVLKGGGRDSISQELYEKCNGEAAKEYALSLDVEKLVEKWLETGRIEQDDITLLEVAGEQMVQSGKDLRVPNRDSAFEIADQSLSNLLRLRKRLITLLLKAKSQEGEPMDPKEQPPQLTKLAEEARRLAREEADVRRQLEDKEVAKSTSPELTRRQQDVAIYDAGELYSELLIHPEKTEGALDLMDEAEDAMEEAGRKLQSTSASGAVLDLAVAEQRLFELAEFLMVLEMQMASEALEKMASELEKEAEELAKKAEGESDGKEKSESGQEPEKEGEQEEDGEYKKNAPKGSKENEGKSPKSDKGKQSGQSKSPQKKGEGNEKSEGEGKDESGSKSDQSKSGSGKGTGEGKSETQGEDESPSDQANASEEDREAEVAELLARAGRRARLTEEVLKALAEREAKRGIGVGESDEEKSEEDGNDNDEDSKNKAGKNGGKGESLDRLRQELGMVELAEALRKLADAKNKKGKNGEPEEAEGDGNGLRGQDDSESESDKTITELAGQLDEAGKRMRELARDLNSSQLARLADVKEEIRKLKEQLDSKSGNSKGNNSEEEGKEADGAGGKGNDENPFAALLVADDKEQSGSEDANDNESEKEGPENYGPGQGGYTPPTTVFNEKLNRLEDETVRNWGRHLRDVPFDRSMLPVLEAIEKRVDELVGEIPGVSAVTGGRRTVPDESRREIEDYFRDLSDDFGSEQWMEKE